MGHRKDAWLQHTTECFPEHKNAGFERLKVQENIPFLAPSNASHVSWEIKTRIQQDAAPCPGISELGSSHLIVISFRVNGKLKIRTWKRQYWLWWNGLYEFTKHLRFVVIKKSVSILATLCVGTMSLDPLCQCSLRHRVEKDFKIWEST